MNRIKVRIQFIQLGILDIFKQINIYKNVVINKQVFLFKIIKCFRNIKFFYGSMAEDDDTLQNAQKNV